MERDYSNETEDIYISDNIEIKKTSFSDSYNICFYIPENTVSSHILHSNQLEKIAETSQEDFDKMNSISPLLYNDVLNMNNSSEFWKAVNKALQYKKRQ